MSGGPPLVSGALQLTNKLVLEPSGARTVGASGVAGFSSTSVTVMITAIAPLALSGSVARTVTEYDAFVS